MAKSKPVPALSEEDGWRAEDDLRTMIAAEKIKRDPKRLKAAVAKKKEMLKDLNGIKA